MNTIPTIPTLAEVRSERDPVRKSILEAILRIVEERPLHVAPGHVSVVALADEAQIKRHWLNQRHKDLKDRYLFIKDHYLDPPQPVDEDERFAELNARILDLEERLRAVTHERDDWKASAEIFVRAMHVQEVDLAKRDTALGRLRRQLDAARAGKGMDEIAARRHRRDEP